MNIKNQLIIFFLFLITTTNAQIKNLEIGFHGGIGISNNRDESVALKTAEKLKTLMGGISLGIGINKNFELISNLSYETKGEKYSQWQFTDVNGTPVGDGTISFKINYAILNVLARGLIGVGNNIKLFANGGPYVGYLINAKALAKTDRLYNVNGSNGSIYPGSNIDISNDYKKIDYGVSAGIGVQFPLLNKFKLSLEVRRNIGLANVSKIKRLADGKTNSFDVLAGVIFKL